jgi:hypothetical protein
VSVLNELQRVEQDLVDRMRELRPAVDEYLELEQTAARLGIELPSDAVVGRRRAQARPGERHEQVLEVVRERPGVTVREIADALGVDPTSLYRFVRELTADGRLSKDGRRLSIP